MTEKRTVTEKTENENDILQANAAENEEDRVKLDKDSKRKIDNIVKDMTTAETVWTCHLKKPIKYEDNEYSSLAFNFNGLKGTIVKYNSTNLSVHHIVSLSADFEKRFDNDNLITLCRFHHEQAEKGNIKPEKLRELAGRANRALVD